MIFDDNSNFAFTVGRLKTLFLRKHTKMPLVTVSEIHCFLMIIVTLHLQLDVLKRYLSTRNTTMP